MISLSKHIHTHTRNGLGSAHKLFWNGDDINT